MNLSVNSSPKLQKNLARLARELVRREQNSNDPDLISSIFRLVPTIKDTYVFLGLPHLEDFALLAGRFLWHLSLQKGLLVVLDAICFCASKRHALPGVLLETESVKYENLLAC